MLGDVNKTLHSPPVLNKVSMKKQKYKKVKEKLHINFGRVFVRVFKDEIYNI